jgi:D-aminoacyl-tRNA deacylase
LKAVIQRVSKARVEVKKKEVGKIGKGLLILLGVGRDDDESDVDWLASKVLNLRIFSDENGKMNLSILDIDGEILLVSQFTLLASTKKGNRPSFIGAGDPSMAVPLYEMFKSKLEKELEKNVSTGIFGTMMDVSLSNSGPVTLSLDTKNKE